MRGLPLLCVAGLLSAFGLPLPGLAGELKLDYPAVPSIEYKGERYKATVPDTLDLAERARLAINGLTSTLDPEQDYFQWFFVWMNRQPPRMQHNAGDFNCSLEKGPTLHRLKAVDSTCD